MLQAVAVRVNHRQINVRIGSRIAVPREMLCRGQPAVVFDAFHKRRNKFCDALGILSERPRVDDRISGVIVHIRIRRVNPMHTGGARFERGNFTHSIRVFGIAGSGQGHRGGKGSSFVVTHSSATFEIGANQQWEFGFRL